MVGGGVESEQNSDCSSDGNRLMLLLFSSRIMAKS